MPTPTVGAVGVLDDVRRHATMAWSDGDVVLLVGGLPPELGGSEYLGHVRGITAGAPPPLDLNLEARVQAVVRESIAEGTITTAHDCSDGGLAVALAEMALVSGIGAVIDAPPPHGRHGRLDERWFGEAASRVVVADGPAAIARVRSRCQEDDVPAVAIGRVGGHRLALSEDAAATLEELSFAYQRALVGPTPSLNGAGTGR